MPQNTTKEFHTLSNQPNALTQNPLGFLPYRKEERRQVNRLVKLHSLVNHCELCLLLFNYYFNMI